jgi:tape measure domain-containing protein
VNNVLEFFIRMKDMASSSVAKMGATVKKTFDNIQKQTDQIKKANDALGHSYDYVKKRIKEVESAISSSTSRTQIRMLRQELDQLNRSARGHAGNLSPSGGGGGLMGMIGKRFLPFLAAGTLLTGAGSFLTSSAKAGMGFEGIKKQYEVLTGSKQTGNYLANELNTLQQKTILGPGVFQNAQMMMSFGIGAGEVLPIMKMLGDISGGNTDRMNALTLAFSQMRAAGRLMGQDLLQFINAGFNPLQEISRRTGVSMGVLKERMEEGAISADMVTEAFKNATSKGGMFYNMMNKMAETSQGKVLQLEGAWESLKIGVGAALQPISDELIGIAAKTINWLNISKTVPEVLATEKNVVNSLYLSISKLNEGNELRKNLLIKLKDQYPDFFGKIDVEKIKNSELLTILNNVNTAYQKRIELATSTLIADTNQKIFNESQSEWVRNSMIADALKMGYDDAATSQMTGSERIAFWFNTNKVFNKGSKLFEIKKFTDNAANSKSKMDAAQSVLNRATQQKSIYETRDLIESAYQLKNNKSAQQILGKNYSAFTNEMSVIAGMLANSKGLVTSDYLNYDFSKLRSFISAAQINNSGAGAGGSGGKGTGDGGGSNVSSGITGGGPRTVNINGVKFMDKLADKMSINNQGDWDAIESKLEEMFLRILNSGASVQ